MHTIVVDSKKTGNMPGEDGPSRRRQYLKEKWGIVVLEDWEDDYGVHRFKIKYLRDGGRVETVKGHCFYKTLKLYLPEDSGAAEEQEESGFSRILSHLFCSA